jgi:hypothetical protein
MEIGWILDSYNIWSHIPYVDVRGVIIIKWTNNDKKDFLNEIFDNMLYIVSSTHHILKINFWWMTKNFWKMYKLYQILYFFLKKHPNFKLYKNMLTILCFIFLDHKLQLCFNRCHVHHTSFTCRKKLLKLKKFVQ